VTHEAENPETDQQSGDDIANRQQRQRPAERRCDHHNAANSQRMAKGDWDERFCHGTPFLLLHAQSYCEEPTHAGLTP